MTPADRIAELSAAIDAADPLGLARELRAEVLARAVYAIATGGWLDLGYRWRQAEHGLGRLLAADAHAGTISPAREARRGVYRAAANLAEKWA